MTVTAGDPDGPRTPARLKTAADWIGHHWVVFVLAGVASAPFMGLFPHSWMRATDPLILVVLVPAILLGTLHDARLCERCAARMPLNGDESAARYARRLHLVHVRPLWFAFILVGGAASYLPGRWVAFAVEIAVTPLPVYAWVASRTHRQLYPWCPRCHWGSGGDGVHEPSPDPSINTPTPQPVA